MTKNIDAGDILSQRAIEIKATDDVGKLFESIAVVGKELLLDTLPAVFAGEVQAKPQVDVEVVFYPTITKEQARISWTLTAQVVDNNVRALRPFPSTTKTLALTRAKFYKGLP